MAISPMPLRADDPVSFLCSLWSGAEVGYLTLWWRETRHTEFVQVGAIDREVPRLLDRLGNVNVYFGLGLQAERLPKGRGEEQTVIAIPGAWIDVDTNLGHSGQNGKTYAPDKDHALALVHSYPTKASIVVDSGNGIHGYWLLREPWYFEHPAERLRAKRITRGWEVRGRAVATHEGYTIDSCHDLARVMRLPGTINRKPGIADKLCFCIFSDIENTRVNIDDLEGWVPEGVTVGPELSSTPLVGGDFVIDNLAPVPDFVAIVCRDDRRFNQTWNRQRRIRGEFALQDQSSSGYELSLVTQVITLGLDVSNQALVDMCAAFRRITDPRGRQAQEKSVAYYENLCRLARENRGRQEATVARVAEERAEEAEHTEQIETARADGNYIDRIRKDIPLPELERILKFGKRDALYVLILKDGSEIAIGKVGDFKQWSKFQDRLTDALKRVIGPARRQTAEWFRLYAMMIEAAEEQRYGVAGDDRHFFMEALAEYVRLYLPRPIDEEPDMRKLAISGRRPWIHEGKLGVSRNHFSQWLETTYHEKRPSVEIMAFLRYVLGESESISVRPWVRGGGTAPVCNTSYFVGPVPPEIQSHE